jgi:hypothetical protein
VFAPDSSEFGFLVDNHLFAKEHGHEALARATMQAIRRYDRRQAVLYFDRGCLGGWLRHLRLKLKPRPAEALFFVSERPDVYGMPERPPDTRAECPPPRGLAPPGS